MIDEIAFQGTLSGAVTNLRDTSPPHHAFGCYSLASGNATPALTPNTWADPLSASTIEISSLNHPNMNNPSPSAQQWTGAATRTFLVFYYLSFQASANAIVEHTLLLNGSPLPEAPTRGDIRFGADEQATILTFVELSQNDSLEPAIRSPNAITITPYSVRLALLSL